jgi:hypothetical protein
MHSGPLVPCSFDQVSCLLLCDHYSVVTLYVLPAYVSRLAHSVLAFSLSSHRHQSICILSVFSFDLALPHKINTRRTYTHTHTCHNHTVGSSLSHAVRSFGFLRAHPHPPLSSSTRPLLDSLYVLPAIRCHGHVHVGTLVVKGICHFHCRAL